MLAEWEKGSTFAPAFGTEEGFERGDDGSEFFESLRPAQDQRGGSRARQGTFNKGTRKRTSRRNPRFRRKFRVKQYYNEEFDPGSG